MMTGSTERRNALESAETTQQRTELFPSANHSEPTRFRLVAAGRWHHWPLGHTRGGTAHPQYRMGGGLLSTPLS